jgi:CubicO group peptidase (beta-lactamase class C family)
MLRSRAASFALALAALPAGSPVPAQEGPDLAATLDAYVAQAVSDWGVPGLAIAVVLDGELVFAKGYGVRELGGAEPVDEHTLFAIGSTTKALTAATVGLQVAAGRMGWDDPVARHLPGFRLHDPYASHQATARDLLTHRAGLGNADLVWYGQDRSRSELLAALPRVEPAYSMRAGFVYQNLMYVAAGELAAALAGTSWEELVTSRIFAPLGMERTRPNATPAQAMPNVARPHARIDGALQPIDNEILDSMAPAGAVWSSVSDLSRWLRMLLAEGRWGDSAVLPEAVVAEMLRPQTLIPPGGMYPTTRLTEPHWTSYGFGWFQQDYDGRAVAYHTGSIDGMSAIVGLVPDEELGVAVLANLDHAELRHALMWRVFDLFGAEAPAAGEARDWNAELRELYGDLEREAEAREAERLAGRVPDTRPSLPLERYAGSYVHELYGTLAVALDGDTLRLLAGPRLAATLEHWHYDTFEAHFDRRWQGEAFATFDLDPAGRPAHLEVLGESYARVEEPEEPGSPASE